MLEFLYALFLEPRSTWTTAFAVLACFVVGALIRSAAPDSIALPLLGGLIAAAIVGAVAWRIESRKHSSVL
jgi:hypothetical protein